MKEEWSESAGPCRFEFNAPHGLNDRSSFEVSIILVTKNKNREIGNGYFRYRKEYFFDERLGQCFDTVVVSRLGINKECLRQGLGTEVVYRLAKNERFKKALFIVENIETVDSEKWNANRLKLYFPLRMLEEVGGEELRVTPGQKIYLRELCRYRFSWWRISNKIKRWKRWGFNHECR